MKSLAPASMLATAAIVAFLFGLCAGIGGTIATDSLRGKSSASTGTASLGSPEGVRANVLGKTLAKVVERYGSPDWQSAVDDRAGGGMQYNYRNIARDKGKAVLASLLVRDGVVVQIDFTPISP